MPDLYAFFCTQIVLLEIQKTGIFFILDGSRDVESTLLALIKVALWRRVPHPPGMLHRRGDINNFSAVFGKSD
jgi:hypothetical protein